MLPIKSLNLTPSAQALLILAVCTTAIHFGGGALKQKVLQRPSLQVLQRDPPAQQSTAKMGAINVIQEIGIVTKATSTLGPINPDLPNKLFGSAGTPDKAHRVTLPASDYFSQLAEHLHIDAITHNGVIINKEFIPLGGTIDAFAYPAPGVDEINPEKLIAPRLVTTSNSSATIREPVPPHRTLNIVLD